jgi:hypothetical protein
VPFLDGGKIGFRPIVQDVEIGALGQEAEVCDRVDLGPAIASLVEASLGENVVDFQLAEFAQHPGLERKTVPPILRLRHARQQVEDRIEARAQVPPGEVPRLNAQAAMPQAKDVQHAIKSTGVQCFKIGIDEAFGRT